MEFLNKFKKETKEKIVTLILGGFGLVASLAWNDAIQTFFNTFFPKSQGFIGKLLYAIVVTSIVVFISLYLAKISENNK